ncbi:MAG: hypothetical protein ACODAG_12540 [Myxococcota bacterium]
MVARATHHPEVARGLASAYGALPPDERRHLIPLVAADASRHGADPLAALAVLLSAEEDPDLAHIIFDSMRRRATSDAGSQTGLATWLAGDPESGSAVVARPLHGGLGEILALRWAANALRAHHEPLVRLADLQGIVDRLSFAPRPGPVPPGVAIDTLATALWRQRRRGHSWPSQIARFVEVFNPPSALVRG